MHFLNFHFLLGKNTFLNFVKDQKCSFSSKTDVFWRAMPKWLVQWEYSEKMLFGTGYNISVRPILTMFMTVSGSKQKYCAPVLNKIMIPVLKKSGSKKKLPVHVDEVWSNVDQVFWKFDNIWSDFVHID